MNKKAEITEYMKELVVARIEVMPLNYKLSIGEKGTFSKRELIEHVNKGDSIGRQVVNMQMEFIRALATGELIGVLNE